jgi:hypothetical protein
MELYGDARSAIIIYKKNKAARMVSLPERLHCAVAHKSSFINLPLLISPCCLLLQLVNISLPSLPICSKWLLLSTVNAFVHGHKDEDSKLLMLLCHGPRWYSLSGIKGCAGAALD